MGIPDSSVEGLIEKVRSWISLGTSDPTSLSVGSEMASNGCKMCCQCQINFTESCIRYHCRSCGRVLCRNCVQGYGSFAVVASGKLNSLAKPKFDIKSCKLCSKGDLGHEGGEKYSDKIYPSESLRQSPEPSSPCFSGERFDGCGSSVTSFTSHPSPIYVGRSFNRSDVDGEDPTDHFFSPSSEYCHDSSDIDSSSVSARNEFYSFKSVGSSPLDSPARIHYTSSTVGHSLQQEQGRTPNYRNDGPFQLENEAVLERPDQRTEDPENTDDSTDDLSICQNQFEKLQRPLDFENNGLIWFPPPPDNEDYEAENNFFTYEDEDDEIGESDAFSSSLASSSMFSVKEKQNEDSKEPLRAVVQGHFRALVSQLLQGEGIKVGKESSTEDWLDIVTRIAWQAANYVKPDTSRGGSMDPIDYVKVKCIASGNPSESTFIKGVACTKNIKHKRMTSQYKNPRLLILGGALEYQRVPNQLASFETLLQQEIDHLKMIVSRIEAHRPNVLLVEKSVSSYAQEYLLAKEISLVLNVKRPLLERIARCTGAPITPSIDNISTARLGTCELFHLEKVSEEHEPTNQFNKKPSKTLMFFEGCPRRLGCTVILKGSSREELRKVKHVVQYAVFAAYHLSLETSFLADEGASLPKMTLKSSMALPERTISDNAIAVINDSVIPTVNLEVTNVLDFSEGSAYPNLEFTRGDSLTEHHSLDHNFKTGNKGFDTCANDLKRNGLAEDFNPTVIPPGISNPSQEELLEVGLGEGQQGDLFEQAKHEGKGNIEASSEYYSATDGHQSILVSFSSRCVVNGTVCERSRLQRIKFYGCFDKPLGCYLRDDLFDQASCCRTCKEPTEAHVICYTHQQGNLTINVRRLPSVKLPGEWDGKIWMWHRCLKCAQIDGVPPATRRVVMSDAAWGLSFGKFLELSFSNHATANRIASCGHSLQRDCLRFYGFGSMVASFRYSPIDILSVHLPPLMLEFNGHSQQDWIRKEASELLVKAKAFYSEISNVLLTIEEKSTSCGDQSSNKTELHHHIIELKDLLMKEKSDFIDLLQPADEEPSELRQLAVDVLELNQLRYSLIINLHLWDRRLYSLDSQVKMENFMSKATNDVASNSEQKACGRETFLKDGNFYNDQKETMPAFSKCQEFPREVVQPNQETTILPSTHGFFEDPLSSSVQHNNGEEINIDGKISVNKTSLELVPSAASTFSDKIDSAWTGTEQPPIKAEVLHILQSDGHDAASFRHVNEIDNPSFRRLTYPARVYSFDSTLRMQERIKKVLPPSSLHLSTLRSFHASGEYRNMIRDPLSSVQRAYSQLLPHEAQKCDHLLSASPTFISLSSLLPEGARLMLPQNGQNNLVIAVYDDEPTSIISYALSSKQYDDWVDNKPNGSGGEWKCNDMNKRHFASSNYSARKSFGSLDTDYIHYGSYGSEDVSTTITALFADQKGSPHLRISFEDDSLNAGGKVKFYVTCYFAEEFDALRKKCCPSELDFVRSLSRCKRWSAQGGKSNAYFAKSLDERLIIKQVTKTELESFEEFASDYFKYLSDYLSSGSPTCLAKILGTYQVTVKNLKGGKETKMDLIVMENLFFKKNISRIYDLKGSMRSRYISDATGTNKVLLDMNLLEALDTKPIFLGSKAKRTLERAVWNDTAFLASVDVMDYSLLVGVDDVHKELILGIIDFMRQYTWDKHLETWVKAFGILGGPKNASPTIISPNQYKKRFRKAMTRYFLTVPDQWSS